MEKIKQTDSENWGIRDVFNDRSLSRRGYVHHSGMDFTPELCGRFGDFIVDLIPDVDEPVVIEFGCGSGVLATYMSPETIYVGLDANLEGGPFVKQLNDPKKQHVVVDLTKKFELDPPVQADLVMSFDFYEHIEDYNLKAVMKHMDRLLKPGGQMISIIDTIPLDEHISIYPIDWWAEQFSAHTNWEPLTIANANHNNEAELWKKFVEYHPPFWGPNIQHQHLFHYRKPIE